MYEELANDIINVATQTDAVQITTSEEKQPGITHHGWWITVGGGVGYWYINKTPATKDTAPLKVVTEAFPEGRPAGEEDLKSDTGTRIVSRQRFKTSLFHLSKGFEYEWNGEGDMVLTNVPAGKIRATVSAKGNDKDLRSQIFIGKEQEGKACVYTLELTQTSADWSEECSG